MATTGKKKEGVKQPAALTIADLPEAERGKVSRLAERLVALGTEHQQTVDKFAALEAKCQTDALLAAETIAKERSSNVSDIERLTAVISSIEEQRTFAFELLTQYQDRIEQLSEAMRNKEADSISGERKNALLANLEQLESVVDNQKTLIASFQKERESTELSHKQTLATAAETLKRSEAEVSKKQALLAKGERRAAAIEMACSRLTKQITEMTRRDNVKQAEIEALKGLLTGKMMNAISLSSANSVSSVSKSASAASAAVALPAAQEAALLSTVRSTTPTVAASTSNWSYANPTANGKLPEDASSVASQPSQVLQRSHVHAHGLEATAAAVPNTHATITGDAGSGRGLGLGGAQMPSRPHTPPRPLRQDEASPTSSRRLTSALSVGRGSDLSTAANENAGKLRAVATTTTATTAYDGPFIYQGSSSSSSGGSNINSKRSPASPPSPDPLMRSSQSKSVQTSAIKPAASQPTTDNAQSPWQDATVAGEGKGQATRRRAKAAAKNAVEDPLIRSSKESKRHADFNSQAEILTYRGEGEGGRRKTGGSGGDSGMGASGSKNTDSNGTVFQQAQQQQRLTKASGSAAPRGPKMIKNSKLAAAAAAAAKNQNTAVSSRTTDHREKLDVLLGENKQYDPALLDLLSVLDR